MNTITEEHLFQCDEEPIHLLRKIQSHGYLLAFSSQSYQLKYISKNARVLFEWQESTLQNVCLKELFSQSILSFAQHFVSLNDVYTDLYPEDILIKGRVYQCYLSKSVDHVILELEKKNEEVNTTIFFKNFNEIHAAIRHAEDLNFLFVSVVDFFRASFSFDRVMVYQFDDLKDGEVVAESKKEGLDSFLGLKYPASDIPKQAFRLYHTNLSRAIKDVNDIGVKLVGINDKQDPLDLSYSVFRSVSDIHIQYLKNMGVSATHSVSLMVAGKLWGMVICHHYSGPLGLSFGQRMMAEVLGNGISQSIELLEAQAKEMLLQGQNQLLEKMKLSRHDTQIYDLLADNWESLSQLLHCCGCYIVEGSNTRHIGEVPVIGELDGFYKDSLNDVELPGVYYTQELYRSPSKDGIAGMARLVISESNRVFACFFRRERVELVNWAGNPEKAMRIEKNSGKVVLSPRASFALWQEKVRGQSMHWSNEDIALLKGIREALIIKSLQLLLKEIENQHILYRNKSALVALLDKKSEEVQRINIELEEHLSKSLQYQKELEYAKYATEQINTEKSNFIANLSHEVRTPLNGVVSLAELILSKEYEIEEVREFTKLILESAERLLSTVNRMLEVSTLDYREQVDLRVVNINQLIESISRPFNILASRKNIKLTTVFHYSTIQIVTDSYYLSQIYLNIMSNAIKYTQEGGKVEVDIKVVSKNSQQKLVIIVGDTGLGISNEAIGRIFEPFYTEHEPFKQKDNSSGLGLYIVKNYLDLLQGTIDVQSVKGEGSTFTIYLPFNSTDTPKPT